MRLVDRILAVDDERLQAAATVRETWPLCGNRGTDVILAVEVIAQSVSAYHHWKKGPGREPRVGFLVGIKESRFHCRFLLLGAELVVDVRPVSLIANYGVFRGTVRQGNDIVCEALVQAVEPEEEAFRELLRCRGRRDGKHG